MPVPRSDKVFAGSIPELYHTYLSPLIFEPYARDLGRRVASEPVDSVLEVAAGTGVVTRAMVDALGTDVPITATDLNQPMLDYAASVRDDANVTWRQADAQTLPFADATFDAVVCQFSVMFFPDRPKAYSEALRVLRPGGRFHFNVWDAIEENEFAHTVTESLAQVFPDDPPRFLARTPHGYSNIERIGADLRRGGFAAPPEIERITARSRAADPSVPAIAYCQGTPLRNEIESRNASRLEHATDAATAAVAERFGAGPVDGKIQAYVITARA
ncbi:MAG: class I SAM-dependent methyltransferase [Planctomycetota bacterium]|jgi:SAM-dependent methyltransferase